MSDIVAIDLFLKEPGLVSRALRPTVPRAEREGEEFTATADCPHCGIIDVHWLDEPRFEAPRDDSPSAKAFREINRSLAFVAQLQGGSPRREFDPPGTVVARICRGCGYRWGQR